MRPVLLTLAMSLMATTALAQSAPPHMPRDLSPAGVRAADEHLALEEVNGTEAMAFVASENEKSLKALTSDRRYEPFRQQAFDILSATLFSDELDGDARGFEAALNQYLAVGARIDPLDVFNAPSWIPRLGKTASYRSARYFEQRVGALVARRRARIEAGEAAPDDLLTALLTARDEAEDGKGLDDREVAANILTFILAGHETTARTLGWALHLISRSPAVAETLQAEADAFDISDPKWAEGLPWTRAVIEEAMRLFPPAPTLARRSMGPDVVGGEAIGEGCAVLISPWILHRHELLWDEPDAFRPERFLPENRKSIDRYAYIPFSAGPRVCIGAAFAMQEAMIALTTLLKAAEVEAISTVEPHPTHQVTLRSRLPIHLRLRPRRSSPEAAAA